MALHQQTSPEAVRTRTPPPLQGMPVPISRAAKKALEHVATATTPIQPTAPKTFLSIKYDPRPGPINDVTYPSTRLALLDFAHPLHLKTKRRYAAFDPNILHWNVRTPVSLSKNAVVRNWATRRVKEAVRNELKARRFGSDGTVLDVQGNQQPLKGAMTIFVSSKNHGVLVASGAEVKIEVSRIIKQLIWKCQHPDTQSRSGPRKHGGPVTPGLNQGQGKPRYKFGTGSRH